MVFGSSYAAHNKALDECLHRLDAHGLTLNFDKCQFLQPKLEFFGLNFSKDGVRPDPKKVSALANAAMPTTVSEVRSFLGMANYSSQFIPNFATVTEPLRQLTHKGAPFVWNQEHDDAYTTLRKALTNSPVMSYFDVNKATELSVDASPVGLSAILAQRDSTSSPPQTVVRKATGVRKTTGEDALLTSVCTAIQTGQWSHPGLKQFKPIKDELSIDYTNNVVLRGTRIVLPSSLLHHVIQLAHEGHQGQARTKALMREHVWFPEMDKKVRAELEKCVACQATGQLSQPEPLRSTPLPNKAWDKLKIDFYGPLPTGQYILVVLDCYSRFPEVEVLSSISAKSVIPKLDAIFARHGVPSQVVSDNGPPFPGHEFNTYMTKMGIKHTTSTPLWPQGNAEVEAFMKPLGKAIRTANLEGRPWKQELSKYLLAYRSTPHSTTKVPPATLLYNREIRGKLPTFPDKSKVSIRKPSTMTRNKRKGARDMRTFDDVRKQVNYEWGTVSWCVNRKRINSQPISILRHTRLLPSMGQKWSRATASTPSREMYHSSRK